MLLTSLLKREGFRRSAYASRTIRNAPRVRIRARPLHLEPLEDRTLLSTVSGTVFEDLDRDGNWDPEQGEQGIEGWTVELQRGGGAGELLQTFVNPIGEDAGVSIAVVADNVLIGAHHDNTAGEWAGAAYLFDASTANVLQYFLDPTPAEGDHFGHSVAAVGSNVLISAPWEDTNAQDAGAVYLFDGSTGNLLKTFQKPTPVDGDQFGRSVAAWGSDVLIGVPYDDTGAHNAGAVYLFSGSTGELMRTFQKPSPCATDNFGLSVAAVGDRVLVGAPFAAGGYPEGSGEAYLFDGSTGACLHTFHNPTPASYDGFGYSVAAVGDNVLIGDPNDNTGAENAGAAYLFDQDGNLLQEFFNPTPAQDEYFGFSLAAVGNNVLVGACGDGIYSTGTAYLFDGKTGELLLSLEHPTPASGDGFGDSVAALGNNLLVGAMDDNVYLFEGTYTVAFTSTGAAGDYEFTSLDAGTYLVRELLQDGYTQTSPDADGTYSVALGDGENVADLNFGNVQNWAPVASDDSYSVNEDSTLVVPAAGALANDTDADGDELTAMLVRDAGHGTLALNSDGSFNYIVAPGFFGIDTFTYKANDGLADSNVATVSISANQVYDRTSFQSADVPKTIRDRKSITSTVTVPESQFYSIIDLNVQVDITHTHDEDLDVFLIAPDWQRIELFTDVGWSGDNFAGTILDDEADISINAGAPPFSVSYRPEGELSAVDGLPAAGVWKLEIYDDVRNQATGTLNGWSITVAHAAEPGITVSPTSGLVTTEDGGADTFTVVLDSEPTHDVTISVASSDTSEGTVAPGSLSFNSTNWSTPQPVTVTGVDDAIEDGNIAYTVFLDPASSTDPAYNNLDPADVSVTNMDDDGPAQPTVFYSMDTPLAIADGHAKKGDKTTTSRLDATTHDAIATLVLEISLDDGTTSVSDLRDMVLTSPEGTWVTIAPVSGVSIVDLSTQFGGEDPHGIWTLDITDYIKGNVHMLNEWSLTVNDPAQAASASSPSSQSAAAVDLALLAWVDLDSSDDDEPDILTETLAADELALMLVE